MEKLYKTLEIDIEVVKVELLEICYITEVDEKIYITVFLIYKC